MNDIFAGLLITKSVSFLGKVTLTYARETANLGIISAFFCMRPEAPGAEMNRSEWRTLILSNKVDLFVLEIRLIDINSEYLSNILTPGEFSPPIAKLQSWTLISSGFLTA